MGYKQFCKEPEKIENYGKAKKDNFKGWHCHHRKGVGISHKELIALGLYYNRPAEELIFLPASEHDSLHQKGKQKSEETRRKMREAQKGKQVSDETRKKISETLKGNIPWNKGKRLSEDHKKKLRKVHKGTHWYNNSKIEIMAKECPEGFVSGRMKRK